MHKQVIFLIIIVTSLAYANSLGNGFIGDDHLLFEDNLFYKDLKNLSCLFSEKAIIKPADLDPGILSKREFSGTMSYRPVTLSTFFIDYFFWKQNPFGFRLTNLLLHILVCLCAFALFLNIIKNKNAAAFAALLFCVHPIHVAAVGQIGFRYDLVASIFYLLTLIAFIQYGKTREKGAQKRWLLVSFATFFLGIFAKESCSTLPIMLIIYDLIFLRRERIKDFLIKRSRVYAGYFLILSFYWYIYLFVFKSTAHAQTFSLSGRFAVPLASEIRILYNYFLVLLLPFKFTITPPLYMPSPVSLKIYEVIFVIAFLFLGGFLAKKNARKINSVTFFILWLFITFIPTSNLIPLINPFAFRYMYLPSIGFCGVAAVFLERLPALSSRVFRRINLRLITKIALLGFCIILISLQTRYYKNDLTYLAQMLKSYPDSVKAHFELGKHYLKNKNHDLALAHFQSALRYPKRNPFFTDEHNYVIYHQIGRCYVDNPDKAIKYFQKAIHERPEYARAYTDIARAYLYQREYQKSLSFALKTIAINEKIMFAYTLAVHSYIKLNQMDKAEEFLAEGLSFFPKDIGLNYLKDVVEGKRILR